MKRKIGLILAIAIALTIIKGMGVTALADDEYPASANPCAEGASIWYVISLYNDGANFSYAYYAADGTNPSRGGALTTMFGDEAIPGRFYHLKNSKLYFCEDNLPPAPPAPPVAREKSAPAHIHDFVTGVIYDATCDHDGLEGTYCKTCGYILNSSPISAFGYTLETYAQQKIEASKSGQKIVLEFGELNSFPKSFMEKIAARVAEGVTFEFRYNVNHKLQKITIPAYSTVDTNLDWYGPATMEQLYGAN